MSKKEAGAVNAEDLGMGEWRIARLGDICDLRSGTVFPNAMQGRSRGDYPFIKVSDMNLSTNRVWIRDANNWVSSEDLVSLKAKALPVGSVVFAKIGEALKANRLRRLLRATIVDNNMMGAVPKDAGILPQYLYYALSKFDFGALSSGTALPYLTVKVLADLAFTLPPLPEQRAIAHILGTLDDKIELNRRMNETLEEMARALFQAWFVDFEPVRAKMEGRWKPGQSLPGLPVHLYDLFPDRLVDSELGEIPEGWEVRPLQSILGDDTSRVQTADLTVDTYISTENMLQNKGGVTGASGVPSSSTVPVFERGDVLISNIRPYFKKAWLATYNGGRSPDVLRFQPKDMRIREFLYCLTTQDLFFEFMVRTSKGVKMPRGDKDAIMAWSFPCPSDEVVAAFSNLTQTYFGRIETATNENSTLASLRDTLLPKLISGEVRVGDEVLREYVG